MRLQALKIDASNVKALYRKAHALRHKDDFVNAKVDIKKALSLAPKSLEVRRYCTDTKIRYLQ